jgi:hypothetical protein
VDVPACRQAGLVKGPAGGLAFEKNSKILESKNLNSMAKIT